MASLTDLLQKARPNPGERELNGPTVALALHCLMVKNGYQPDPSTGRNPYTPQADWNARYKDEWRFEYTRRGYENGVVLHCSLQAATGKMFVQGRETGTGNVQILGLQIENYSVAPEGKLTWRGMIKEEEILEAMFKEHIVDKLDQDAAKCADDGKSSNDWFQRTTDVLQQRDGFIVIGLVSSALIVGAISYYVYRRRHQQ